MKLRKVNNQKSAFRGQKSEVRMVLFSILSTLWCLLYFYFAPAVTAETHNSIKTRIEGDTTNFTIEVKDADIKDVLRALAKQNNLNIIVAEDITARVTFSLQNITFKDALEVITRSNGLDYAIQNNVLWVGKKEDIAKVGEDVATEIIQLNYAKAADVAGQLKGVLSERGSAVPDNRKNAIILKDAKKNIEDAKFLVRSLDTRTRQVVIEARIVEAQSSFARDLGIQWGVAYGTTSRDNFSSVFGSTTSIPQNTMLPSGFIGAGGRISTQPNFAVNLPASGTTGVLGALGLAFGKLTGDPLLLDLRISAGEKTGKLKIVSQPKVTTLNNTPATIHSGLTFKVRTSTTTGATTAAGGVSVIAGTGLQDITTGIDLTVTPQITSDDFILLNIAANKSDPDFSRSIDGIPGVTEKKATTSVLVKDGETTVIGGLYQSSTSDTDNAIPFLSKIPIIGYLFKSNSKSSDNQELLVFITPRIAKYSEEIIPAEVRP